MNKALSLLCGGLNAALVYLTRAAGEFGFFPGPNPVIVVACLLVGGLHLLALRGARAGA